MLFELALSILGVVAIIVGVAGLFGYAAVGLVFAVILIVVGLLLLGYGNRSRFGGSRL